ncbi:MAG: winged helix DNA-binding domain-containing protein [Actinomycetota bacterium]
MVARLPSVEAVTQSLVVLHATDPATVYLSVLARLQAPTIEAVDTALYDTRSIVRTFAMRKTLFGVRRDDLPMVERSASDGVHVTAWTRLAKVLVEAGIADPDAWLAGVSRELTPVLADEPDGLPARTITARVPALATKLVLQPGTTYSATVGATSRTLGVLAGRGLVVRGRPTGTWTDRQYRWQLRSNWLDPEPHGDLDPVAAAAALLRAWLERFGPAPMADLRWWTGWPLKQITPALALLDTVEVDLDGDVGIMLADDQEDLELVPCAALLPSLDPTPMGWKVRHWYLGDHEAALFDRNGNIGPTVWVDGRIVGGWAQRPDGSIVTELLEDVGADRERLIDHERHQLQTVLGTTVVKPSFPTPLQKSLSG